MDTTELQAVIGRQITQAVGYQNSEVAESRRKLMRDYMGQPMGNEIEGRSQVVSSDVQDTVETQLPDHMQMFASTDQAVQFNPTKKGGEEQAQQATDYVNYIWNTDNNGFLLFYDGFKDALLQKLGVYKVWWNVKETTDRRKYSGLTDDQLTLLTQDKEVKTVEHDEYWCDECLQDGVPEDQPFDVPNEQVLLQASQMVGAPVTWEQYVNFGRRHKVTIRRKKTTKRVKCVVLPPEEFLISQRATSLDDAPFLAHATMMMQSDLIAEGYDPDQIDAIPDSDGQWANPEKTQRFLQENQFAKEEIDRATREIAVYECYVRVDWDKDGIAELRKITVGGPEHVVLKYKDGTEANEEVAEHPFQDITPIRMPHKVFGVATAELAQSNQYVKTSAVRQWLDNMYNVNNAREAISNKVNMDDALDNKVASKVRVNTEQGDVAGHIVPMQTAPIGNHIAPLIAYMDQQLEQKTGVTRLGQGLDPDALHSTASGINQLLGRSQQRTLLVAQLFAFGIGELFRKILRIVVSNQDETRTIQLRGEWAEMDPRDWDADMTVSTDVGLGRGTRENQVTTARMMVESTNLLIGLQGGPSGPLVNLHQVSNVYSNLYEAAGVKNTDLYITKISPEEAEQFAQQQGQQENPEVAKARMEQEAKAAEMQQKGQIEAMKAESDHTLKMTAQQLEYIVKMQTLGHTKEANDAKLALDAYLGQRELQIKEWKAEQDASTARIKAQQRPKVAA
jgi:hypothetical protein